MNKPYMVTKKCKCCNGTGKIRTYEGHPVDCPYCKGTGMRTQEAVHPSHSMSNWRSEILAPAGTPRFYSVRHCKHCTKEEWEHAAGHFFHGLSLPCKGHKET